MDVAIHDRSTNKENAMIFKNKSGIEANQVQVKNTLIVTKVNLDFVNHNIVHTNTKMYPLLLNIHRHTFCFCKSV